MMINTVLQSYSINGVAMQFGEFLECACTDKGVAMKRRCVCTCSVRRACAAVWRGETMKYPCLIPKRLCKTPVHVHLESEELNNLGAPKYVPGCRSDV